MHYRLPMSFVYFYDTYAISTKMNSLKKNVRNSFQKTSPKSKNRPPENVIQSHNGSINYLEVHIHIKLIPSRQGKMGLISDVQEIALEHQCLSNCGFSTDMDVLSEFFGRPKEDPMSPCLSIMST